MLLGNAAAVPGRPAAERPAPTSTNPTGPFVPSGVVPGGYVREWTLFHDYCAATGQPALPTSTAALLGFLSAVPAAPVTRARRIRAIIAVHRHAGHLPASGGHEHRPVGPVAGPTSVAGRVDPARLLAACPSRGWPGGLSGRRDAFLIVLTQILGFSHTQARRLAPTDLETPTTEPAISHERDDPGGPGSLAGQADPAGPEGSAELETVEPERGGIRVGGRPVPTGGDPRRCPACAVTRWLGILGVADGLGRGSARMQLTATTAPTAVDAHTHSVPDPARWRGSVQLLPAIDRHGWLDDTHPLSTRAIHTRLATVTARAEHEAVTDIATPAAPAAAQPEPTATAAAGSRSLDEVLGLLDEVAEQAETLNTRIQTLLDEQQRP